MAMYSNILVPVDLSENCVPALKHAINLQKHTEANLTCFYVVHSGGEEQKSFSKLFQSEGSEDKLIQNHALPKLEEWLDELQVDHPKEFNLEVRVGSPANEITQYASEANQDLIVTGTHGRTGLQRMWIGSVADRVVKTAPCPVLTVRSMQDKPNI